MRGAIFWGARPSRVLVLLSRQHELLTNSETKRKVRRRETQRPTRSPRRIRPLADETRMLPRRSRSRFRILSITSIGRRSFMRGSCVDAIRRFSMIRRSVSKHATFSTTRRNYSSKSSRRSCSTREAFIAFGEQIRRAMMSIFTLTTRGQRSWRRFIFCGSKCKSLRDKRIIA